jgi:hypothetical protein
MTAPDRLVRVAAAPMLRLVRAHQGHVQAVLQLSALRVVLPGYLP